MGYFEWLGFRPTQAMRENYGKRPGMASFAQIELIRALWRQYTCGGAGEGELNKWLLNKWQLPSLRFLPKDKAWRIITALKAMKLRRAA